MIALYIKQAYKVFNSDFTSQVIDISIYVLQIEHNASKLRWDVFSGLAFAFRFSLLDKPRNILF